MDEAENRREKNCCRPEADTFRKSLERVAAEEKLFSKTQSKHRKSPGERAKNEIASMQSKTAKSAAARKIDRNQDDCGWNESPQNAFAKKCSGIADKRQTIRRERFVLDSRH
ncbi:MAG TPA: hypothetical protein VKD70_08450 [Candidatus Acidoferrum sp.]|nr:hypothetical protein [Candidatus Acidoferrum sp.]